MSITDVFLLEVKRKRKEFNYRTLLFIVPLLILFVLAFVFVTQRAYYNTTPVYVLVTDSDDLSSYTDNSLFTPTHEGAPRSSLLTVAASSSGSTFTVVYEYSLAQRAGSEALRSLLRQENARILEENAIVPPVLLNITELFREELIQNNITIFKAPTFDQPSSSNSSGSNSAFQNSSAASQGSSTTAAPSIRGGGVIDFSSPSSPLTNRSLVYAQEDEAEYSTVNDLDTLSHIKHVFVAIEVIVILNFFAVLFASSIFQEKINRRSSLLFVSPLRTYHILIGKMLPYFCGAFALIFLVLVLNRIPLVYIVPSVLVVFILSLLYFSVSYVSAIFARSHKEFSFLSVFAISIVSLYLIIPAFVANYSLISNASLLTPLVLYAQGISVAFPTLFFLCLVYLLITLWIFYIASFLFSFEEFYSTKGIFTKIVRMAELYVRKFHHAAIFTFFSIPIGWLVEVMLIIVLLVVKIPHTLYVIIFIAAFVEEFLRNLPIYAYFKDRPNKEVLRSGVFFSLASGFGFGLAEKLLLFIMVAPFIQGYAALVLGSFIVPLLLHSALCYLFLLLRVYSPWKHYAFLCVVAGIVHAFINISLLGVLT